MELRPQEYLQPIPSPAELLTDKIVPYPANYRQDEAAQNAAHLANAEIQRHLNYGDLSASSPRLVCTAALSHHLTGRSPLDKYTTNRHIRKIAKEVNALSIDQVYKYFIEDISAFSAFLRSEIGPLPSSEDYREYINLIAILQTQYTHYHKAQAALDFAVSGVAITLFKAKRPLLALGFGQFLKIPEAIDGFTNDYAVAVNTAPSPHEYAFRYKVAVDNLPEPLLREFIIKMAPWNTAPKNSHTNFLHNPVQ